MNAELQPRLDLRQRRRGAFAAGDAVGDDADVMTALDLAVCKVQDVAKNPADGGAHDMQDAKRLALGHGQHQHLRTNTVSPQPDSVGAKARDKIAARTLRISRIPTKVSAPIKERHG